MKKQFDLDKFRDLLIHPEKWKIVSADYHDSGLVEQAPPPYAAKQEVQVHADMREIMIALQGNYIFRFNRKYYKCKPGTVFLIDKGIEHEANYVKNAGDVLHLWTYTHQKNTVIHCVSMQQNKLQNLTQALMHPSESPDLDSLWDLWQQAGAGMEKSWYLQQLKLYLAYSFSLFFLHAELRSGNQPKFKLIEVAMERIRLDLSKGIRIENLARIVGYSKFHFVHLFKQFTGRTVLDYVNYCRLERLELLLKQNISPKEIAAELGFQDVHSYYQWIRLHNQKKQMPITSGDRQNESRINRRTVKRNRKKTEVPETEKSPSKRKL